MLLVLSAPSVPTVVPAVTTVTVAMATVRVAAASVTEIRQREVTSNVNAEES
jgi:hypothetical protein